MKALLAAVALMMATGAGAQEMTRYEQFKAVIEAWGRKDADFVLSKMADDVVWHMAATAKPPAVGKAAAAAFLKGFGTNISDKPGSVRWRIIHHAETADRLFVEGVDEYDDVAGRTITAPYMGVIEFRGDLIVGWRDYVDYGTISAQVKGEPMRDDVKALATRPAG